MRGSPSSVWSGFRDPPRVEVKQAIADCRQAGIRVVMVTGDHAVTARKIAEGLGIAEPGTGILVEGRELEALGALGERQRVLAAPSLCPRDAGTEARARAALPRGRRVVVFHEQACATRKAESTTALSQSRASALEMSCEARAKWWP